MSSDECAFNQGDLCCFNGPCEFRGTGWECNATDADLMTEEEYEAMKVISASVQKIFADAVNRNPLVSIPDQKEVPHD